MKNLVVKEFTVKTPAVNHTVVKDLAAPPLDRRFGRRHIDRMLSLTRNVAHKKHHSQIRE